MLDIVSKVPLSPLVPSPYTSMDEGVANIVAAPHATSLALRQLLRVPRKGQGLLSDRVIAARQVELARLE